MSVVIDCSALFKLVANERGTKEMVNWWTANQSVQKRAPALLSYELGRCLQRQGLDAKDARQHHADLLVGFVLEPPNQEMPEEWTVIGLTHYDAAYVALARRIGVLVTADRHMANVARTLGIAVHEIPA